MAVKNQIERSYVLRNYETDFRCEIKPSAVLGFFQEAAGDHSVEMGLGFQDLAKQGYYWVLSKIYVEFMRRPMFGETVHVATWPHEPNKAIYERSFTMRGDDGELSVRAFSRWCILRNDGRIVPCSRVAQPAMDFLTERAVSWEDWVIPTQAVLGEPDYALRVANSEYDLNRHVNNIKYADYVFNCFSVRELEAKRLRSFQLHYVKQSFENDHLAFYRQEIAEGDYVIEGIRNGDETVVTARVRFA